MKKNKHSSGFGTPKGYFEDFEDRLFSRISEDQIPKDSGFKVPDGYFSQFDDIVIEKYKESVLSTKVIPLFSRRTLIYAASIAASAILVFSLYRTEGPINIIDEIEVSSIEKYIEDGMINIESTDVTALLTDDDLTGLYYENDFLNEDVLEYYLLENIDEITLITE